MSSGIVIESLTKSFGLFRAVDDVSFEAEEGRITALLGPSGSGKSTVLRMIAGLEDPDEGRIWVDGEEQTPKPPQDRRLGFVFQHYALFRHVTVRQNVAFGLSVRKASKAEQRSRVDELLDLVGLSYFAERYPDQLSGGQRQRVALARALAPRPKVLLLDEPFGALDARVRQELRRWLDGLHRELGVTSLLVTHTTGRSPRSWPGSSEPRTSCGAWCGRGTSTSATRPWQGRSTSPTGRRPRPTSGRTT